MPTGIHSWVWWLASSVLYKRKTKNDKLKQEENASDASDEPFLGVSFRIHHTSHYPELYGECVEYLKTEQDNLSGYTEKPLRNGVHIDHYRKQALFNTQDMVFGWENLIADEHNSSYGADYKDRLVTMREEYAKLINPVLDDPHHYLTYMDEGIIKPVDGLAEQDREKAEKTIEVFNLRHPLLKELRERAIRMVKDYKVQGLTDAEILEALHDFGFTSAVEYALQGN